VLTILASTSLDSSLILEEEKTRLSFPSTICVNSNETVHSIPTEAKAARKVPTPLPNAPNDMIIGLTGMISAVIGRLLSVHD
jgi:hypothetical protein